MNKLLAIYMCALLIVISIVLPIVFPALAILTYVKEGFSEFFIFIAIITILIEPLAIVGSYALLTSIKDIYNDLHML